MSILIVSCIETSSGCVVIDDLAVRRYCPYISIKSVIVHTVHTLVVISRGACIISVAWSVAHTAGTSIAVVLVRQANMLSW